MLLLFPGYAEPLPADPAPQQPDHHADRGLSGETWPSWEGIECIPHFPHDFPTVDNTPNVAGWRVRARSPKYRPRLQASHERKLVCLDETAWVSLKQWKLHRRAVNGWKANYARWKATLPEPANNVRQGYTFKGAPKFENALIDVLDRRRFEAIKAQCADDDMDIDGGNKQKTKISKEQNAQELIDPSVGQQLSNDAMESLSSLSIQQQEPTKPKPIFSVAGLLKELTIDQTQPERRIATPRKLTGPTKRPLNYWQHSAVPPSPPGNGDLPSERTNATQGLRLQDIVPGPRVQTMSTSAVSQPAVMEPNNPFYHQQLTFPEAAQYIHEILRASGDACHGWLQVPVDEFRILARQDGPGSPLLRMCSDFNYIKQFVVNGREGWNLTHLPDNFFADMEALLMPLLERLRRLGDYEDCAWLRERAIPQLQEIRNKLTAVKSERLWIRFKMRAEYDSELKRRTKVSEEAEVKRTGNSSGGIRKVPQGHAQPRFASKVDLSFGGECGFTSGSRPPAPQPQDQGVDVASTKSTGFDREKDSAE
ncbi:hypothetical protein LTR37_019636 [Vermiconidia calcicola]|uniref:Uncharacterized protein n=1 Tax=Vermiconidia calcicola TaxID=1690605 RepID=A0ACC3MET6_9PEZI|nr:hypothetical protein LTR37_019636 [Vermiconidia calcicola]